MSLLLEDIKRFHHDFFWFEHAHAFNVELKHILSLPKVNLVSKLLVALTLSAGCALSLVFHVCFPSDVFNVENAHGTKLFEVLGI